MTVSLEVIGKVTTIDSTDNLQARSYLQAR